MLAIILPELSEPKFVIFPMGIFMTAYEVVHRHSVKYVCVIRLILLIIMYLVCTNHAANFIIPFKFLTDGIY